MVAEADAVMSGPEEGEVVEDGQGSNSEGKHALECKWTLWFDPGSGKTTTSSWGQTLMPVYSFQTVEDFWCLFNNIKPPSWLPTGSDFHLFKSGIEPKWEDPMNAKGGQWTLSIAKGRDAKAELDKHWLDGLLACIGEQFTEGDDICGIVVNLRARSDRISLWTRTAANEQVQMSLGKELRQFLGDPSLKMSYKATADQLASKSAKDRYVL
ncbi:hypothetical protein WJX73_004238 [Symbiochloris irregularis]|uniref:eIF-4F 25 kDa subunit n=1 Tax=Symbiochloris irregularis TaxID=706552 RepID=A0AAW1PB32_9CHLO